MQIRLVPLSRPLVQQLIVPVPPAPGSDLAAVLGLLTGMLADAGARPGRPAWPPLAGLTTADALRRMRLAAAWCGPGRDRLLPGRERHHHSTVRLAGPAGWADLGTEISDQGSRALTRLTVSLGTQR